jgi:hypothetical protein
MESETRIILSLDGFKKNESFSLAMLSLIASALKKKDPSLTEADFQEKIFSEVLMQPNRAEIISELTGKSVMESMAFLKYLLDNSEPD